MTIGAKTNQNLSHLRRRNIQPRLLSGVDYNNVVRQFSIDINRNSAVDHGATIMQCFCNRISNQSTICWCVQDISSKPQTASLSVHSYTELICQFRLHACPMKSMIFK